MAPAGHKQLIVVDCFRVIRQLTKFDRSIETYRVTSVERYWSTQGRMALAERFGLRYSDLMQDWEWEVADARRFDEFLDVYSTVDMPDDQRFSLMEVLIQCVEDTDDPHRFASYWSAIEPLLLERAAFHRGTIEYWAMLDNIFEADPDFSFRVSPAMRRVWFAAAC